jgi:hypothetical protein
MKESQLIGNILAEDVNDGQQQHHHQSPQDTKSILEEKAKVAASISRSSSAPPSILPEEVFPHKSLHEFFLLIHQLGGGARDHQPKGPTT